MRIFTDISTNNGYETIEQAVRAVKRREQMLREQDLLDTPWSLVELRLAQEDFTWLIDWTSQLSFGVAQRCLEDGQWRAFNIDETSRCSFTAGIGTLLLLSAVEVARRETDERSLWRVISQRSFSTTTRKLLFNQGYPTRSYKDAIELASRWLGLRHVFGIQGLQNWYDTIYLQLGFSYQGYKRRLPEWLAGYGQTQSIQQLSKGPMASGSFSSMWNALRWFQGRNLTEKQVRATLSESPWILPEWIDDLIKLSSVKPIAGSGNPNVAELVQEKDKVPFLGSPTLRWNIPHKPRFVCAVTNLALMDLQETMYTIVIAGQRCASLQRQADGSYRALPSDEIELPVMPQVVATLSTADGEVEQRQVLQLWDENEDINAFFQKSGLRFDLWEKTINPSQEVFLLLADDLILEPPVLHWYHLSQYHVRLYFLSSGWSSQTRVLLDGHELWLPALRMTTKSTVNQQFHSQILVLPYEEGKAATRFSFGAHIQLYIVLPANCQLVFLRACGRPVTFQKAHTAGNCILTEKLLITPQSFTTETSCKMALLLGLKTGTDKSGMTRLPFTAELPISGAALLTSEGWVALRPDDILEADQAKKQPLKIFSQNIEKQELLEGDVWIQSVLYKPRPVILKGYGAPLKLCGGVYNHYDEPHVLAREVINHGIIAQVEYDTLDTPMRLLNIHLAHFIEMDKNYPFHWWDRQGTFSTFTPACSEIQGTEVWWLADIPPHLTEPIAVAITYSGSWLGSWWSSAWNVILHEFMQQDPGMVAALMRWFHLPLLGEQVQKYVRDFAFTYPGETLAAWITESSLPVELRPSELDESWLSVVRTIFWSWQPTTASLKRLMAELVPDAVNQSLPDILSSLTWKLLRVSPLLMGSLVRQWVREEGIPSWGILPTRTLVQQLIYGLVEADNRDDQLRQKKTLLEAKVADEMKIDQNFMRRSLIQRALGLLNGSLGQLERLDRENLALAMNTNEPFRRFLGIELLESLIQDIK